MRLCEICWQPISPSWPRREPLRLLPGHSTIPRLVFTSSLPETQQPKKPPEYSFFFFFMSHLLLTELKPHLPATQFPPAIWGLPRIPFEVEHRWDGVCCWLENYSFAAQIQHSHGKKLWEFHVNPPLFEDFHWREAPAAQVSHGDAAGGFKDSPPSFQGCWWDPAKPREQSRVCQDFLRQQSPNYLMDTSAHSSSPPR